MSGRRVDIPAALADFSCSGVVAFEVCDLDHGVRRVGTRRSVPMLLVLEGGCSYGLNSDQGLPWQAGSWKHDGSVAYALPADLDALRMALVDAADKLRPRTVWQLFAARAPHDGAAGYAELAAGCATVTDRGVHGFSALTPAQQAQALVAGAELLHGEDAGRWLRELLCEAGQLFVEVERVDAFLGDPVFCATGAGRLCLAPMPDEEFVISARSCAEDRWYLMARQAGSWFCLLTPEGLDTQQYAPVSAHVAERYATTAELAQTLMQRARFDDGTRARLAFVVGRVFAESLGRGFKDSITVADLAGVEHPAAWVQSTSDGAADEYDYSSPRALKARAAARSIRGRTKMDPDELRAALAAQAAAERSLADAFSGRVAGAFVRSSLDREERATLEQAGVKPQQDSLLLEAVYAHRLGAGFCHEDLTPLAHRLPERPDALVAWRPLSPFAAT